MTYKVANISHTQAHMHTLCYCILTDCMRYPFCLNLSILPLFTYLLNGQVHVLALVYDEKILMFNIGYVS